MDQQKYSTLEHSKVELEKAVKGCIILGLSALTGFIFLGPWGGGMGQGWVVAFPIALGWILWDAAGLITRREALLDHRMLWPLLVACVGWGPVLFMGTFYVITRSAFTEFWFIGAAWALPWTLLGLLVWWVSRLASRERHPRSGDSLFHET